MSQRSFPGTSILCSMNSWYTCSTPRGGGGECWMNGWVVACRLVAGTPLPAAAAPLRRHPACVLQRSPGLPPPSSPPQLAPPPVPHTPAPGMPPAPPRPPDSCHRSAAQRPPPRRPPAAAPLWGEEGRAIGGGNAGGREARGEHFLRRKPRGRKLALHLFSAPHAPDRLFPAFVARSTRPYSRAGGRTLYTPRTYTQAASLLLGSRQSSRWRGRTWSLT